MINTDIFIEKGDHLICQDYAISGMEPFPYVIISDGCSSSKDTDVGARILALSAKNFLTHPKDYFISYFNNETERGVNHKNLYNKMGLCIINKAFSIANLMSLELECLDATLIVSFIIEENIYTYVYGDGNIILVGKDSLEHINIKFPSSAPFYLSYYLNPERMKNYFKEYKNEKLEILNISELNMSDEPVISNISCKYPISYKFHLENQDTYLIASDGLESFISNGGTAQDVGELMPKMVCFKNFRGQFIMRRFKRFLSNIKKDGIHHFDDISIGGFHIE